jgi:hypothetical protein
VDPVVRRDLAATPERAARRRVTVISAPAGVPREALEEFRAAGNLQHQLGELARSERPGDRLAAGHRRVRQQHERITLTRNGEP